MVVLTSSIFNFLAGIIYAFGFPNWFNGGIWLLPTMASLILFFSFTKLPTNRARVLNLLIFSLSFNLVGYYWIPHTLTEFGGLPYWLSLILSLFFTLIIVPHYWCFLALQAIWAKTPWKDKALPSKTLKILLLSFLLTSLEFFVPQQFPGHLGHNWLTIAPYIGLAPIGGVPLFSLASYILLFWIIEKVNKKKPSWASLIIFILFCGINFAFPLKKDRPDDQNLSLRVVQPNVGNFLKLDSEKGDFNSVQMVLNSLLDLSTRPAPEKLDLIVWPETAYPYSLHTPYLQQSADHTPSLFKEIIDSTKAELLLGGYDLKNPSSANNNDYYETEFNSAFLFDKKAQLKDSYHKKKLIPFGETLPLGPLKGLARHVINNITYFAQGDRYTKFKLDNGLVFITPICYELLFPNFIADYLAGEKANFIINLTNDSWYGKTSELEQHLFLAKWRALEFGRPIIRSTNTGITSVIFTDGSESERLPIYQETILDLNMRVPKNPETIYERFGFEITAMIFLILLLISYFLEKPSLNKS